MKRSSTTPGGATTSEPMNNESARPVLVQVPKHKPHMNIVTCRCIVYHVAKVFQAIQPMVIILVLL